MTRREPTLSVLLHNAEKSLPVGSLFYKNGVAFFEYDAQFLLTGIELSPFYLPLKAGVFKAESTLFEGLFGLFNDSLPDGWGRLLLDRKLRASGKDPSTVTPLDRLSIAGLNPMGALQYHPNTAFSQEQQTLDLDAISSDVADILKGESEEVLDYLIALNGSSAGARPKIMASVSKDRKTLVYGAGSCLPEYEEWIIKFRSQYDSVDIASIEYAYSLMARDAGIEISPTHLFTTLEQHRYFGIKRFDRVRNRRIHMHSLSGLLHVDYRIPSLDYRDLLKATLLLTKDMREVRKMYLLSIFNVLTHNRDDHTKNFSFIMDEQHRWHLSPAYDLTFSTGMAGEHITTVMGEGKNPGRTHLIELGERGGFTKTEIDFLINQVQKSVDKWPRFAEEAMVSKESMQIVKNQLEKLSKKR